MNGDLAAKMSPRGPVSVFGGTGFIGQQFRAQSRHSTVLIPRDQRRPETADLLYLISTTDNYGVFDDPLRDVDVNLRILLEVLRELDPAQHRVNFISSWFVYGAVSLPAREGSPCNPKGFYSITKRAAEQLLVSYCQTFGIHYRILRLCNVYGETDRGVSARKNALQYLIGELRQDHDIALYHGGNFLRDYLHVTDVVRAIDLVLDKCPWDTVINIGAGQPTVFREAIDLAHAKLRSRSRIASRPPTPFHAVVQVKDFFMDTTRLRELGFQAAVSLEEGMTRLCRP
jgi:nucleoside-diphosphate-sugar epimerase